MDVPGRTHVCRVLPGGCLVPRAAALHLAALHSAGPALARQQPASSLAGPSTQVSISLSPRRQACLSHLRQAAGWCNRLQAALGCEGLPCGARARSTRRP